MVFFLASRCSYIHPLSFVCAWSHFFSPIGVCTSPKNHSRWYLCWILSPRGPAGSSSRWAAARTTLPAPQAQLGEVKKWCCRVFQKIPWKLKAWIVDVVLAKFLHHKVGAEEVLKCLPHFCTNTDYSFPSNRAFSSSFLHHWTHLNSMMQYSPRMMQYDLFARFVIPVGSYLWALCSTQGQTGAFMPSVFAVFVLFLSPLGVSGSAAGVNGVAGTVPWLRWLTGRKVIGMGGMGFSDKPKKSGYSMIPVVRSFQPTIASEL